MQIEQPLSRIRIILVEPAGPRNIGSVARVMKNMGLTQLVLVNPQCDPLGPEALQMAVHAKDLLETARQVASLPEALQGCQRAIATTGRVQTQEVKLELPREGLPWLVAGPLETALIFGREDRGLSNEELQYAHRYIRIPTSPAYVSLNLAQAVAICCYELHQLTQEPPETRQRPSDGALLPSAPRFSPPAAMDTLEQYYQQLETLLLQVGYLYPHTAPSRMKKFRQLFNRAQPSDQEIAMLRGILSQIEWAVQHLPRS